MKTNTQTTLTAIPNFPGIVIDPESGRKCALQIDIMINLRLSGHQVKATGARIYGGRYYDIEDIISAREKTPGRGRPRKMAAGVIITELVGLIVAALAGTTLASVIIACVGTALEPTTKKMSRWHENNVITLEHWDYACAPEARKQFEAGKLDAFEKLEQLKNINLEGN